MRLRTPPLNEQVLVMNVETAEPPGFFDDCRAFIRLFPAPIVS
jgi:hypothetical protein